MLVLSRKQGQKLIIGDNIEIVIVEIRGDRARLGIDAPTDVSIHREEVHERLRRGKECRDKPG